MRLASVPILEVCAKVRAAPLNFVCFFGVMTPHNGFDIVGRMIAKTIRPDAEGKVVVSGSPSESTVSVVTPNYNHAASIERAIESLQRQTWPVHEIIVVDDGSTDHSIRVIQQLQAGDQRIKLVQHECNKGAAVALNAGLAHASGTYIHFAAADDTFRPVLVGETLALLEAYPDAAFACGEVAMIRSADGISMGYRPAARPSGTARAFSPAESVELLRHIDNFVLTPATLFRRNLVIAAGGFDASLASFTDGHLVRRLALTHGFCFTPKVLAEWRIDDAGYSRSAVKDPVRGLALLDNMKTALMNDPVFPSWYPDLFVRRWRFSVARIAVQSDPPDFATLQAVAPGPLMWWVIEALRRVPPSVARLVLLSVLTLRLRPMSLMAVLRTWSGRHLVSS